MSEAVMRSVALLAIVFPMVFGIAVANGQGLRSSSVASQGAGMRVHGGWSGVRTTSRVAPSVLGAPSQGRALHRAPHVHTRLPVPIIVPRVAPQPYFDYRKPAVAARWPQAGVALRAPHVHSRLPAPVIVPRVAPQPRFNYGGAPLRRHPGILIIDLPYVSQSTVIMQVAPGVMQEVRRQGESPSNEPRTGAPGQLAPFDPMPVEIVDRMLAVASLQPGELLYDLGAGDGRVVIAAAKHFAVRAVGFEIDPGLVKLARENVRKQGVESLVEIRQQDFLSADLSPASVVTLYLSHDGNLAVRPKLMTELKPGARVVSYTFAMGEWQAKITERYRDKEGQPHTIYLWQMGEPMAFR